MTPTQRISSPIPPILALIESLESWECGLERVMRDRLLIALSEIHNHTGTRPLSTQTKATILKDAGFRIEVDQIRVLQSNARNRRLDSPKKPSETIRQAINNGKA